MAIGEAVQFVEAVAVEVVVLAAAVSAVAGSFVVALAGQVAAVPSSAASAIAIFALDSSFP